MLLPLLMLLAQAGEAIEVAKRAGDRLMVEWGVAGVLVLVIIAASTLLIRHFIKTGKDDRETCAKQHAELVANFDKRAEAARLSREKEMDTLCDTIEKWRKTSEEGDKAMRDVFQLWMNKMADKVLDGGDDDGPKARRKPGGAS